MAKNELVSLALVYHEPMHAYAINAIIKEMGLEHWAYISPASIYAAFSRLEKIGCVEVSTEKVGNMPERKVYTITPNGKERLLEELREAIVTRGMGDNPFYLAVSFAYGITAEDAIPLLEKRIGALTEALNHVIEEYKELEKINGYSAMIITKAGKKHIEAEIEAAREFIELLREKPEYYTKDLPNMLKQLLQYRE